MDITLLRAYLLKNSTQKVRSRSYSVDPEFIIRNSKQAISLYNGTQIKPYIITVEIKNNKVATSCTCPYNFTGICKHAVATLRALINNNTENNSFNSMQSEKDTIIEEFTKAFGMDLPTSSKTSEAQKKEKPKKALPNNQILLQDNKITADIIPHLYSLVRYHYNYSDKVKLTSISFSKIEAQTIGWNEFIQKLNFNKNNHILTLNCSCNPIAGICGHSISALEIIYEKYGPNFFKEDFLDNIKKEHLAKFNLTLDDDYQKYFTYELTAKGVEIKSPFKNIKDSVEKIELFDNETTKTLASLPFLPKKDEVKGLGFVFKFSKKEFSLIQPVKAKYNKNKTDFASSFVTIKSTDSYDRKSISLYELDDEDEQELVAKVHHFTHISKQTESNGYISDLKKGISIFQKILPKLSNFFLYQHYGNSNLTRKNLTPIKIVDSPIKLFFTLTETGLFYTLKAKVKIKETNYNLSSPTIEVSSFFIKIKTEIYPIKDANLSASLSYFNISPETNYLKTNFSEVYEKIIMPLSERYEIQSTLLKKIPKKKQPIIDDEKLEKHIYISDLEGTHILFKPVVNYNGKLIPVLSNELLVADSDDKSVQFINRNQSYEDNFLEEFRALHPEFSDQEHLFYLTPEQLFEDYWMLHATDRMKQLGIQIFGANDLKSFKYNLNKPTISVSLKSEIDWFDVAIDVSFGNQKVNLKDIRKAILKKSNYVTLGDGTIGILPEEWLKKFTNYFKVGEIKKDSIQLSNYQFGVIDELYNELETKPTFLEELYQKKQRLQNISSIKNINVPKGIKANLRDYQQHGLNWLTFLDTNKLGGCLADDMGLGKTLQAITFLMYLKKTKKKLPASLIIAPTSLIFNWKNEIDKFAPTLKLVLFVGANRKELQKEFNKNDLVISTYGSLLNDITFLQEYKFNYVILDESQAIKNPNSKRYKAVRLLKSYNRLVLTGTPIENNTFDLYAQFNFLNPGLLGSMNHFKNEFSKAIDKDKNVDASKLLSNMVSPFILRRTKEQVAKELPDKTEEIMYCEMSKEQRNVYEAFKNKYRDYLLNKIDENGAEKSQIYVLEGLTKLRQICNSTALINTEEDYGNFSIKLERLIETIKNKTRQHKILIFSQFVKMLQLIKSRLEAEKIDFEYLDGHTTNREEKVEKFQNNKSVRAFLISLKAGGTGLNLTEADYVFIVDPWWNPAVENQAIDRCYRIGQSKNVMAYRMICKDTIEEKILQLQNKKKTVAANVIQVDDAKKSFDAKQIKALFS